MNPWSRVHMDHAYINQVGLLLILVDTFSSCPEVIRVSEKKSSAIKQILRVIFSRNGIPKAQVSNNAPEFCDEDLILRLEKIGCKPYKTSLSIEWVSRKNGTDHKNGTKKKRSFSTKLLLSYLCY